MLSAIRSLGGARSLVVVIATLLVCLSYMTSCDARAVRNRSNRRLQRNRGQDAQPQPVGYTLLYRDNIVLKIL